MSRTVPFLSRLFLACSLLLAPVAASAQTPPETQAAKPQLTVYTYAAFVGKYGPGRTVKERFEAVCACEVTYVAAEDAGSLLGRLRLEGASNRADAVLGLDMNLAAEARELGLFAPHEQGRMNLSVPVTWTDDVFVPVDWGYLAFVYDSSRLANPPKSLAELVDDPRGPRIILEDPRTSAPGLGFLLWMREVYGDRAEEAWAKLKPRIVTFTKGWSEAYGLFLKGEGDMVLSYSTSPAYHIAVEKKTQYRAAAFAEGHYMHIELAGRTRNARNADLARRFLAFVLSDPFQSAMPEGNWMYPARTPLTGLPASFADLIRPEKPLLMSPEAVAAGRRGFIDAWLDATSR